MKFSFEKDFFAQQYNTDSARVIIPILTRKIIVNEAAALFIPRVSYTRSRFSRCSSFFFLFFFCDEICIVKRKPAYRATLERRRMNQFAGMKEHFVLRFSAESSLFFHLSLFLSTGEMQRRNFFLPLFGNTFISGADDDSSFFLLEILYAWNIFELYTRWIIRDSDIREYNKYCFYTRGCTLIEICNQLFIISRGGECNVSGDIYICYIKLDR